MGIVETIAITMGIAWASGINLYATLAMLGILGATGQMALPPDLQILAHPLVIAAAGFMYFVEFFADKVPGVDSTWDSIHTFIRIPAAVVLAAAAVGEVSAPAMLAAAIVGGALATTSHGMKAGSRVLINTSPEPFSNWGASLTEDVLVVAGLGLAIYEPTVFLGLLVLFVILAVWLLPKIWRGVKRVFSGIARLFGSGGTAAPEAASLFDPALLGKAGDQKEPPKLN